VGACLGVPTFWWQSSCRRSPTLVAPDRAPALPVVDYSAISALGETEFCRWLTAEIGVAAIPLSAFYADGRNQGLIRFCFAKQDATLRSALQRLARL